MFSRIGNLAMECLYMLLVMMASVLGLLAVGL